MTSDNIVSMASVGRRVAFARVFTGYSTVLFGFMRSAVVGHPEKTIEIGQQGVSLMSRPDFYSLGVQCLAAQFAARLLATRAGIEKIIAGPGNPLELFQAMVVQRTEQIHADRLKGFSLQSDPLSEKALRSYENDLANVVFRSFRVDVECKDFDEEKFWCDLFRGIGDSDRTGSLARGFQFVFLDHLVEYRHFLDLAMFTRAPAPAAVM